MRSMSTVCLKLASQTVVIIVVITSAGSVRGWYGDEMVKPRGLALLFGLCVVASSYPLALCNRGPGFSLQHAACTVYPVRGRITGPWAVLCSITLLRTVIQLNVCLHRKALLSLR